MEGLRHPLTQENELIGRVCRHKHRSYHKVKNPLTGSLLKRQISRAYYCINHNCFDLTKWFIAETGMKPRDFIDKRENKMTRVRRCRYPNCHEFAFIPNHYCKKHIAHEKELRERNEHYRLNHKQSKQSRWHYNHITRYHNPVKAKQNRFYHTKQWETMRIIVLKRDYHLCQYCKAKGQLTEGNIVDHILPVERYPEHMKDLKNLVTCCSRCHYWKTRFEEQYYGTGLHGKPTGNPPITDVKLIATLSQKLASERHRTSSYNHF